MALYRTSTLENPASKLNELAAHIDGLGCLLTSATFSDGHYVLVIDPALPAVQLDHLGLEEL